MAPLFLVLCCIGAAVAFLGDFLADSELVRQSSGMREVFRKNLAVNVNFYVPETQRNDIQDSAWQGIATNDIVDVGYFFQLNDDFVFVSIKRTALPAVSLPRQGTPAPVVDAAAFAGLPDGAAHPLRINAEVSNVTVVSNVACVPVGLRTKIYFVAHEDCFGPERIHNRPGSSSTSFDHDDNYYDNNGNCYGQLLMVDAARNEGIFAYSSFATDGFSLDDAGFCTNTRVPSAADDSIISPNWMYTKNSATYSRRHFQVFLRLASEAPVATTTTPTRATVALTTTTTMPQTQQTIGTTTTTAGETITAETITLPSLPATSSTTTTTTSLDSSTTAAPAADSPTAEPSAFPTDVVIGGAVGGAGLLICIAVGVAYALRRRKREAKPNFAASSARGEVPHVRTEMRRVSDNYIPIPRAQPEYDSGRLTAPPDEYESGRFTH
jgi:hypothetical protein